jgi:hypothetical protein
VRGCGDARAARFMQPAPRRAAPRRLTSPVQTFRECSGTGAPGDAPRSRGHCSGGGGGSGGGRGDRAVTRSDARGGAHRAMRASRPSARRRAVGRGERWAERGGRKGQKGGAAGAAVGACGRRARCGRRRRAGGPGRGSCLRKPTSVLCSIPRSCRCSRSSGHYTTNTVGQRHRWPQATSTAILH